jgi:hypothetical protein
MLLLLNLAVFTENSSEAQFITRFGEGSWHRSGLFCFASDTGKKTRVQLIKIDGGAVRVLFSAGASNTVVFSPVCLSNGVVFVDVDGYITKLDLAGERLFKTRPSAFEGAIRASDRVNANCIFVTETVSNTRRKGLRYQLHLIDVSGSLPAPKGKFEIVAPIRVVRTSTELVVIGEKITQRIKIPKDIGD